MPSKFLTYLVVLCFKIRCPKPNTVARLNSEYLPQKFFLGRLRFCCGVTFIEIVMVRFVFLVADQRKETSETQTSNANT